MYTRTELRTVPVSQHLFDIKHGGFVFHGDPAVLDLIPDQPAGELPKTCAWTLVINRLSCLLESVQESFFETPPAGSDLLLMEYMAHKIVLCAAEALLIMRGTYDVSYARRAEAFAREFADRPDAVELVKRSTRFKLLETVADDSDPAGLWFEARDLYLGAVTECARPRLGPRADSWTAIAGLHEGPWLGHWLRRLKWRFLDSRRHQDLLWWRRKARLEMAELFLLVARRAGGGAHEEWLARARDRLAPHAAGPIGSWEEVRRAAIWCERRFVHPVV
ncbi:MAG: hypothetical protein HY815_18985 [Candidatus Riflebacteria bacterium]|nr:hypothetical protein [Candidatus Riflebacteria bacterium]